MRRTSAILFIVLAFLGMSAAALIHTQDAHAAAVPLLPGETTWNGVPSFLFGSNDGVNWDTNYNMDVVPDAQPIQASLKSGGMPIIRTWFFQNSLIDNHALSDTEQLQKLQAVKNSGAICFANFPTGNTVAYDLHLLSILNGACPYVEVMNEPDLNGVDSTQYLAFWNNFVPQARAQFPGVYFGGPASYNNQGNECTYTADGTTCFIQKVFMGMKASGVLPDFVTYHWYPCGNDTAASCLSSASGFADAAQQVIDWDTQIFGHQLPVICSEWNADPGSPTYMFDRTWDGQFVTAALQNMETSGLAGAMEYDISQYGNYGADDLFDIYNNGQPFATWTAFAGEIARVKGGTPPPPPPTQPPTPAPTPAPTQPPSPSPSPTPVPPAPTPPPVGCAQGVTYNRFTATPNPVAPGARVTLDLNLTANCADTGDTVEFDLINSAGTQLQTWTTTADLTGVAQDVLLTETVPADYPTGKYTVVASVWVDGAMSSSMTLTLSSGSTTTTTTTPIKGVPCTVTLNGKTLTGKCSGTFIH